MGLNNFRKLLTSFATICISLFILSLFYIGILDSYSGNTYVPTTEYDLLSELNLHNGSLIDNIMIERYNGYALVAVNITNSSTNMSSYNLTDDMCPYNSTDAEPGNTDNKEIEKKYYQIEFEKGSADKFIERIEKISNRKIRTMYFAKQETIIDIIFVTLRSILPIFTLLFMFKLMSFFGGTGIDKAFTEGMDMQNVTKNVDTRFSDIAGMTEAKIEIKKYVDIIKNRDKYTQMGASLPRGVLLSGPPGCGKTLLAKAVAGESGVTFIATSGSDFDEVFVGVGSSRVRKLFDLARKHAPSIIFIDEIDSIGGKRSSNNISHESGTINKILAEMDGFKARENIFVMASTNREDKLDEALIRSGRFDAKIYIDPPTKRDRSEIFKLYLKKIKLQPTINLEILSDKVAHMTPGMTGADIYNICNQATINSVSNGASFVSESDIVGSIDDIGIGIEKKSRKVKDDELKIVAYHESGHALIGYLLKDGSSPVKLSITPRGHGNLGYTQPYDNEDKLMTKEQYISRICSLLAGRIAEMLVFEKCTSGASDDFTKATRLVETMICRLGMTDKGIVTYNMNRGESDYMSGSKRKEIEDYTETMITEIYRFTMDLVHSHKHDLEKLATKLLECERLDADHVRDILPDKENSENISLNLLSL